MTGILDALHTLTTRDGFEHFIQTNGALLSYIVLFAIVFSETGLLFGFFLPGDSLLVIAGLVCATGKVPMDIATLNLILIPAAIIGDATGFMIGLRSGPRLMKRPDGRFFKHSHLEKTKAFYDKHGGKTIIIARFIPVIRTFAPVIAGLVRMPYRQFVVFNVTGAVLWIATTTLGGYWLGRSIPDIDRYLLLVIGGVIFLSLLPPLYHYIQHRSNAKKEGISG